MSPTYVLLSCFEFAFTAALALLVVYVHYRSFVATNSDYDAVEELRKGNTAVAVLLSAMLWAGGSIVKEGIYPVVNLVRLQLTSPGLGVGSPIIVVIALLHVLLVFIVAVFTISLGLRFWGRLNRTLLWGDELKKGNLAAGIVLAGVVLVLGNFMSDGVSHLTKALIPQPSLGQVERMR